MRKTTMTRQARVSSPRENPLISAKAEIQTYE
jgi:hypothetical protein